MITFATTFGPRAASHVQVESFGKSIDSKEVPFLLKNALGQLHKAVPFLFEFRILPIDARLSTVRTLI